MNLQSIFNQQAFELLPKIQNILNHDNISTFARNQIKHSTLREAINSFLAIDNMTSDELDEFQNNLIASFKAYGWIQ